MAAFNFRIPDDLAARFDTQAATFGGRSARLRQLIEGDCAVPDIAAHGQPERRAAARLMVRLAAPEARHVAAEAARLALPRAAWVAALVRRHARSAPTFGAADSYDLLAVQTEVRRIGVNVNQMARALNTAVLEGRVLNTQLTAIEEFRRELGGYMTAIREAFAGNLAYWDAEL